MKKTNKKGFTLVELLVVIAIIAIIAAVAVPVTITQIDKAKIGAATEEANNVKNALNSTLTDLTVSEELAPNTAVAPAEIAATLAADLTDAFMKLEQVTDVYLSNTGTSGEMVVTIVTKVPAKKQKDAAKGYISVDTATFQGVENASGDATGDTSFVAVQYKFQGPTEVAGGADKDFTIRVQATGGTAWAQVDIPSIT